MAYADLDQHYAAYKSDPTPDNLHNVVKALKPTIDYHLGQQNSLQDPLIRAKAVSYAADAVRKYDPKFGASLPTFLSSQLRQLSRAVRQSRSPVRIPERVQIESMKLNQAKQSFFDEFNREPDTLELADYTGVPVKRIEKIRTYQIAMPSEEGMGSQEISAPDFSKEALEYVYHDADHTDRRILDMKLGYAGHPVSPAKDVAVALNLSPTQLSRRSARLSKRIHDIEQILRS